MKDPIERQDAIDALYELYEYQRVIDPTEAADLVRQGIFLAEKKIENVPSAQPRKTGYWNFIGDNMFECTSCGVVYTTNQLNSLRNYDTDPYAPKFCPSCGADMRGEQNEAD